MILTTHAIVGAAVAEIFPSNPILGFFAAFFSHFILDAIPHWDYKIKSHQKNPNDPLNGGIKLGKDFIIDILKVLIDLMLGFILSFLIFSKGGKNSQEIAIIGALGGMFPDALQFAYWIFKINFLRFIQKIHFAVHHIIKTNPPIFWRIFSQIAIVAIIIAIVLK